MQCNILLWNSRGIANRETQRALLSMVRARNPSLIFLSETLAQPVALEALRISLGFSGCICYPCENGVQGIALLWNNDLHVKLRTYGPNHIDTEITSTQETFRFTGVYGFAPRSQRYRTWQLIKTLAAQSCSLPWIMGGDFNEIMSNREKSGGLSRAWTPMQLFRQTMAECELLDMGFHGSKYTW